jgi:hypothetical protein
VIIPGRMEDASKDSETRQFHLCVPREAGARMFMVALFYFLLHVLTNVIFKYVPIASLKLIQLPCVFLFLVVAMEFAIYIYSSSKSTFK